MGIDALVEQWKTIPDWRRGRAVQHPLWLMLPLTLLEVMSGCSSLRGLADFSKIRAARPATLMALLRSWALTAFRKAGLNSFTQATRQFKHDLPKLFSFL